MIKLTTKPFTEMINKTEMAKMIATRVHAAATYGVLPYMYHVESVVAKAKENTTDEAIISACYLHDTIEDGDISFNKIKELFGEEVSEIVYCVTNELGRNRQERHDKTYPKIKGNPKAQAVKLCDRVANVSHSKSYAPDKIRMYRKEHESFIDGILPPVSQRTDLVEALYQELKKLMHEH